MAYIPYEASCVEEYLGMPTVGRAVTATLFVSPNGDGCVARGTRDIKDILY